MISIKPKNFKTTIEDLPAITMGTVVDHFITHNLGTDKVRVTINSNNASTGAPEAVMPDFFTFGTVYPQYERGFVVFPLSGSQLRIKFVRYHAVAVDAYVYVEALN